MPASHFLPHIDQMAGYAPGEQPKDGVFIKLNTNENPYPPSPRVFEAIQNQLDARLRLYPDPMGTEFRNQAGQLFGLSADHFLPGNGSDDVLTILARSFVGPGDTMISATPSYILYKTLSDIQNAHLVHLPFEADWSLDPAKFAAEAARTGAKLAFLANPNSPSGTVLTPAQVADLARRLSCSLVVDEAYADFADAHCVDLVRDHPNVIITRTFSKGYGLAGLRLGYLVARPEVVAGLIKVKDSYNCDRLSLAGGTAALADQAYLAETRAKILATRARLTDSARSMGYQVPDSHANFIWCLGGPPATPTYEALKSQHILVRLMRYPGLEPAMRITVGTDAEIDRLLEVWRGLV